MKGTNKILNIELVNVSADSPDNNELFVSSQGTAKEAIKILVERDPSVYKDLTAGQKKNLIVTFASKDKIVYGKAFDIVKLENNVTVNFDSNEDIEKNIKNIKVCEIKSTKKKLKKEKFEGYFFGLTTAELLVAQNLKDNYKFIFVNTVTKDVMELTLKQIFEKAKGIYPQWSILF